MTEKQYELMRTLSVPKYHECGPSMGAMFELGYQAAMDLAEKVLVPIVESYANGEECPVRDIKEALKEWRGES